MSDAFPLDEEWARAQDRSDPLAPLRERFHHPADASGERLVYLAGNSLGLMPRAAADEVQAELDDWRRLGVEAHFDGRSPWYRYHEPLRAPMARVVGARPDEVVVMNGLTVNLHLMLVSFYRPARGRFKVLMEPNAFPSDTYAVRSQIEWHGHDSRKALIVPETDEDGVVPPGALARALAAHGDEVALVLLGGVNYYNGQTHDLDEITRAARAAGCAVGFDLAHAAGNLALDLSACDPDFAVWCSYKYLNAGPGGIAGCFVSRRHAERDDLPRLAGWWGNDPETRFRMHLLPDFVPVAGADGWQLSNPPILAMAPLRASLELFDEAGMGALRAKSRRLTGFLQAFVDDCGDRLRTLTPRDARGCQLSLRVAGDGRELFDGLRAAGVVGDYRPPDVVRLAPVPLYNGFHDVWRVGQVLRRWARR